MTSIGSDGLRRRLLFGSVLVAAMAAATLMPAGLGILAPFIRDDLEISRTQIGVLITTVTIGAAVISPTAGVVTDRLGSKQAVGGLFATAIVGFIGLAVAPSYGWMLVPVAIAALAQAGGNPSTNKLIASHVRSGRRGVVTGIKQSGVQAGVFVGGVVLPLLAGSFGWRWAVAAIVVVPALGLLAAWVVLPADRSEARARPAHGVRPVPSSIRFLAVYGGLMGFGAAYTFLIPLFAEDELGMTEQAGGLAAGIVGLVALFSRIAWSRHADIGGRHDRALMLIAIGSVGAAFVLLAAQWSAPWLIWPGVVLTGATSSAWNSVGMLAVIEYSTPEQSGGASGVVMLGFLTGHGVAPTLFGWLIDASESYTPMWAASITALGVASLLAVWWSNRTIPDRG